MSVPATILALAAARGSDKTICPSEVARSLWPKEWRRHMEEVRSAAFALKDGGKIQISQKGKEVTGSAVKGPIRIRILQFLSEKADATATVQECDTTGDSQGTIAG